MQTLETLYLTAGEIDKSWCDRGSVDWSEAEQLVRQVNKIPEQLRSAMPEILGIIAYADVDENWDSGEVARWPELIRNDIENFDKEYDYRESGDNWEVYSLALTGEEEWKATVETESIAKTLVKSLAPRSPAAIACPDRDIHPTQELVSENIEKVVGSGCHEAVVGNTNCLAGMGCPKCSQLGPFRLTTKGPDPIAAFGMGQMELYRAVERGDLPIKEYMATWHDDGSEDTGGDTEFVHAGAGECLSCGHAGLVKDFKV